MTHVKTLAIGIREMLVYLSVYGKHKIFSLKAGVVVYGLTVDVFSLVVDPCKHLQPQYFVLSIGGQDTRTEQNGTDKLFHLLYQNLG